MSMRREDLSKFCLVNIQAQSRGTATKEHSWRGDSERNKVQKMKYCSKTYHLRLKIEQ